MSNRNFIRIDYDDITDAITEEFTIDPDKNYLTYMVYMDGMCSYDETIKWEMINKEIPVTDFEYTNFTDQEDFKLYIQCYFENFQSPLRVLNRDTAVMSWGVFFIQEMNSDVYFDFVNDLIEFDEDAQSTTMSYENFTKFIQSDIPDYHNTAAFCVIGPTRPIICNINTNS